MTTYTSQLKSLGFQKIKSMFIFQNIQNTVWARLKLIYSPIISEIKNITSWNISWLLESHMLNSCWSTLPEWLLLSIPSMCHAQIYQQPIKENALQSAVGYFSERN